MYSLCALRASFVKLRGIAVFSKFHKGHKADTKATKFLILKPEKCMVTQLNCIPSVRFVPSS